MSSIVKHNTKTWTDSERVNSHVYDEQFHLEIHHNDKKHQQNFVSSEKLGINTSNAKISHWVNWTQYESNDGTKYWLTYPLEISNDGEYWIEVLYHHNIEGNYPTIWYMDDNKENVQFKGSDNFMNRHTKSYHLQKGKHEFRLTVDPHILILGLVVKKIDTYTANQTLSKQNKLTCVSANHTVSDKIGADEFSFDLLYDNEWKDPTSLTDYLFDYRDEVNFSVMNSKGEMEQIFGGYITTCSLNKDETILTIKCAGRLIDGEKRYIVEEMNVGGDAKVLTEEHKAEDIQRFDNFNGAIDYLFNNYETILNSNMSEVFKEKEYEAIDIDLTKKENYDRVQKYNMLSSLENDGVYLRNQTGKLNMQQIKLYDSDWYTSNPACIEEYPIFYMTYGMGEPMTTTESNNTETGESVSTGEVVSGQFKPSCGCCAGAPYKFVVKYWKNYCPACKRSGTLHDTPKGRGHVPEGEWTCGDGKAPFNDGCDADYCGYCGGDKYGKGRCRTNKLVPASTSETSNVGNSGSNSATSSKTLSNVFQTITDEAFRYSYRLGSGTCSSFDCMQRVGYGDCWAFSDLIFTRLKQAGIGARIMEYATSGSARHHSVMYKDSTGEWQDFPYRQYGWGTRYNNYLNNTSASKTGKVYASSDGGGVGLGDGAKSVSNGFDKDKQFMAWIRVEFSQSQDKNSPRESFYIDFTGHQSDKETTFRGFTPISLNNIFTTGSISVVDKLMVQYNVSHVYLRSISLEYQVLDEPLWENTESNIDNSSYRMILKNVGFRNGKELNPTDLASTGKSLNEVLNTVVEKGELQLKMYPSKYRRDDRVMVKSKVETTPKYTVIEGKDGNVLDISEWSFTPVSDYINRSLVVYKSLNHGDEHSIYNYLASRKPEEIMMYGELSDLVSISDDISSQEAYYESVSNPNFGNRTGYALTVTVVGCPPDLQVGDFVECILEDGHYTDYKEVKSINHVYSIDQSPKLQTKIGLNKPEKGLALKDEFEAQRKLTKSKRAVFGKTATYNSEEVFKWED